MQGILFKQNIIFPLNIFFYTQQAFTSDIPSWMHASPITLSRVILIFMFHQQEMKFWLIHYIWNMTCASRMFDSYRFTRCSPLWFVNPLKYFSVQFSSRFLAGTTCIHVSCYLSVLRSYGRFLYFHIKCCSLLKTLSSGFCLVNYECDASLALDHSFG